MRPPPSFSRINVPITCSRECRSSDPSPCVITRGFNGYGQCVCVGSLDCMNYFKWSRAGFFVEWRSELETDEGWVKQASLAAIDIRCENNGRLEYSRTVVLVLSTCNNEASRRWASFFFFIASPCNASVTVRMLFQYFLHPSYVRALTIPVEAVDNNIGIGICDTCT